MARPQKIIDYEAVEKLASMMCTQEEIASYLGVSVRTLQRKKEFCRVYKKGIDQGKMSLRRKQFLLADSNATMGIWLGKQYLDQKDKQEEESREINLIVNTPKDSPSDSDSEPVKNIEAD